MPSPEPEITDPSNPDYIFQAIRERIYNHGLITTELIVVIAHFLAARHNLLLTLEDVSGIIVRLQESRPKLRIHEIAMRRVPHGYYSEDVEAFFGRLIGGGYADSEKGGIKLNDKGLKIFQEITGEFFSDEPIVFIELARSIWQVMYPVLFKAPII